MELKEIKLIVAHILESLEAENANSTRRAYEIFVTGAGKKTPKNVEILKKFDYQFKKHRLSLSHWSEERKSLLEFSRNETITFRKMTQAPNDEQENLDQGKVKYVNAGTIQIAKGDSGINLYKHQEEAVEKLQSKIIRSNKNPFEGLLVLPTGGGKTLTAAYWLAKNYLDKGKKVLWVAHRHELLVQAHKTFLEKLAYKDIFPNTDKFSYRIISGIHDRPVNIQPSDNIIISSKDSLMGGFDHLYNNWLKHNGQEVFLVIDEAHHATAKTYRRLITNLREKVREFRLLGLTATPFRTAEVEQGLLAKVFPDDIVYKIDLRTLISRGILSEPIFEEAKTDFDMGQILSEKELDTLKHFDFEKIGQNTVKSIAENRMRNMAIINRYVHNREKYKKTIVFALNVDNAVALNKLFQEQGVKSDYVISSIRDMATGPTDKDANSKIIERFRKGDLEVIINVNILTEGTDIPNVQSVFLARPTISPILMTQMIGRGLRGETAGGTKEAYIVSFIDEWREAMAWVNPEQLLIEKNIDFEDKKAESREKLIRLVSLSKIEEFASLANKTISEEKREELERLEFIERIPVGIYNFSLLIPVGAEAHEKNREVLVYDNLLSSYKDFINSLPAFFQENSIADKDYLSDGELEVLYKKVEDEFFHGCLRYPAYEEQDIKDVLQYYAQFEAAPKFVELKDRSKYDLGQVAKAIVEQDRGRLEEEQYKSSLWDNHEVEWQAFFGYNKRYFLNEIDLAIRRLLHPEQFMKSFFLPKDEKEERDYSKLDMGELRAVNPQYWKQLSDGIFEKHKDAEGYFVCASSKHKSTSKRDFQIDHIKPISKGGLTIPANLQLLYIPEHRKKGVKWFE